MFCGLAALSMQTFFLQDDSNSFQDCYIPLLCRFKCFHVCHRIQLQTRDVPTSNFLYRKPRDTARLVGGFWGNISLNSRRVLTCDLPENSCITTRLFPASNVKCCMPSLTPTASPSTATTFPSLPRRFNLRIAALWLAFVHWGGWLPRARVTLERLQRMLQPVLGGLEPNFMQAGCHTWCHRQGRIVETARACCLLGNSWSFFKQSCCCCCCCCCRRTQHLDGIVPLSPRKISRLLDWQFCKGIRVWECRVSECAEVRIRRRRVDATIRWAQHIVGPPGVKYFRGCAVDMRPWVGYPPWGGIQW